VARGLHFECVDLPVGGLDKIKGDLPRKPERSDEALDPVESRPDGYGLKYDGRPATAVKSERYAVWAVKRPR